ncbi:MULTISPECIES: hypothetical protein [Tepidanaerobacter]|jgi:hypothetical protein|uniref:hypothetical protein n=1 Tax=Tepidanaerobacter TaxID=499228 RepID=UPI000AF686B2|nr:MULTISPECIES: hypothetical protein [Tepidanaerobacter]
MGTVSGRIGGTIGGYDINATVENGVISGRIGGMIFGDDIDLKYSIKEGFINGRLGGAIVGKSVEGQISPFIFFFTISRTALA